MPRRSKGTFGLPGVNKKKKVGNGNYLWIQYFYSYLNKKGRSGFVMASSASDAGGEDKVIRQKLVESGHVDVMIAIGTNFFYTRTLPCMLWFFDKGKPKERLDRVLMIDARSIHRKVTRVINDFSPEQLQNISSIVWLHRGETDRFLALVRCYLIQANETVVALKEPLAQFVESMGEFVQLLNAFGKSLTDRNGGDGEAVAEYRAALAHLAEAWKSFQSGNDAVAKAIDAHANWIGSAKLETNKQQHDAHDRFEPVSEQVRSLRKLADAVIKTAANAYDIATKKLAAVKSETWKTTNIRGLHKDLIRTTKEGEDENLRVELFEAFKQPPHCQRQVHWLQHRFPDAKYADVAGLCRLADKDRIAESDWSLTPGRYVGVAVLDEEDDEAATERLMTIHEELQGLNTEASALAEKIESNFAELFA